MDVLHFVQAYLWHYVSEGKAHAVFASKRGKPNDDTKVQKQHQDDNQNHQSNKVWKNEMLDGYLLRISKEMLCHVNTSSLLSMNPFLEERTKNTIQRSQWYISNVIIPSLQTQNRPSHTSSYPFIDLPQTVTLPWSFVQNLRRQALESGCIPPLRLQHEWNTNTKLKTQINPPEIPPSETKEMNDEIKQEDDHKLHHVGSCCATLHRNHTFMLSSDVVSYQNDNGKEASKSSEIASALPNCLCLELKPKAGYLAYSSLVRPALRHMKYTDTKFRLMQQLMVQGVRTRNWGKLDVKEEERSETDGNTETMETQHLRRRMSEYCPLAFFASCPSQQDLQHGTKASHKENEEYGRGNENKTRRMTALEALFDNPQNNLKLWHNGKVVFDHHHRHPSNETCAHILESVFGVHVKANVHAISNGINHRKDKDKQQNNDNHQHENKVNQMDKDTTVAGNKVPSISNPHDKQEPSLALKALQQQVAQCCSLILSREHATLLQPLRRCQEENDILDADGACLVYERLVELCGGDFDLAESLVDSYDHDLSSFPPLNALEKDGAHRKEQEETDISRGAPLGKDKGINEKFHDGIGTPPQKCESLHRLLDLVGEFRSFLQDCRNTSRSSKQVECQQSDKGEKDHLYTHTAYMDKMHQQGLRYVQQLDKEASVWLLQRWLLSLAMCDVSLLLCLHGSSLGQEEGNMANRDKMEWLQGEVGGQSGFLLYENSNATIHDGTVLSHSCTAEKSASRKLDNRREGSRRMHYMLKLIDIDPKPAKKLRGRRAVEDQMLLCDFSCGEY